MLPSRNLMLVGLPQSGVFWDVSDSVLDHTEPEAFRRLRRYLSPNEIERHLDGPNKSRFMIVK